MSDDIPKFEEIVPFNWQLKLLKDMQDPKIFDYNLGVHTILLSGAVGSAKSLISAHIIWKHILSNPAAFSCLARLDYRRLKDTSMKTFLKHKPKDKVFNKVFQYNISEMKAYLQGRDIAVGMYYSDMDFERFKSLEFSCAWLEEGSENATSEVYKAIKQRIRVPYVKEKFFLISTNPEEPEHWINQELIQKAGFVNGVKQEGEGLDPTIHVYYSITADNPFMDKNYVEGLLRTYNELEAKRFIHGQWVSLYGQNLYWAYGAHNHRRQHYKINTAYPIHIGFDFNTAHGKPMSCCLAQYIKGEFHFFDQVIMQGNTTQLMTELLQYEYDGKLLFDYNCQFIINGDAAGWAKQSSSNSYCDYDIIKRALDGYKQTIRYRIIVPKSNPDVKVRHNTVNAYCKNAKNEVRLYLYEKCFQGDVNLDQALRLTKLKKGTRYIENDGPSEKYQHVGTSCGYLICETIKTSSSVSIIRPT